MRMGDLIQGFEEASCQKVNMDKSLVFFNTNISQEARSSVCQALQMNEATGDSSYLGLPNIVGHNKSNIMGFLKDKVRNRVQSLNESQISQDGREVLIKNVTQELPKYVMSVFLLTLEITKDFERSLSRYWWGEQTLTQGFTG